jgi:DNA-binding beta-propeller fold protein YncE
MRRVFGARIIVMALAVVLGATAALSLFAVLGAHGAVARTGPLTVRAGLKATQSPYVRADGFYDGKGRKAQLEARVSGAMTGPLSPVAVRSGDGKLVVYNTWRELRTVDGQQSFSVQGIADGEVIGVPELRIHEESGRDQLLARGAYSAAVRADGAIAFVEASQPEFRAGGNYVGRVVVRQGAKGHDLAWIKEPAHYVVYGWAGSRLLVYRVGLGEKLELLVADSPGRVRPLADGSAIALSPDATRLAVVDQEATNVRVIDVATGRELSWLDVTTATPALRWVSYSGSWVGDHVVAPANTGLAVFHVRSTSLELEQALSLDRAQFPVGVQQPSFVDDDGNEIAATADIPPSGSGGAVSFFIKCDRITRSCKRGAAAPAKDWLRPVEQEGGNP